MSLTSIDGILASSANLGMLPMFYQSGKSGVTAATATSGYISGNRHGRTITMPSMGAGVTALLTKFHVSNNQGVYTLLAIEYNLGTLTVSGSSWAVGVTMPTKVVAGVSVQTNSTEPMLVITTSFTATTPTVTITYTNQDGTGSRTATMTLPTNVAATSAFSIAPHLQSGDTGMLSVENVEISAGTAGVASIRGLLPLATSQCPRISSATNPPPLGIPTPQYRVASGELLAFYNFFTINSIVIFAQMTFVGDQ